MPPERGAWETKLRVPKAVSAGAVPVIGAIVKSGEHNVRNVKTRVRISLAPPVQCGIASNGSSPVS